MKGLNEFVIEEKKTTGAGSIEMIKLIISELKKKPDWKGKDKELWYSAGQFVYDYLKELTPEDYENIVNTLELPDLRSKKELSSSDVQAALALKLTE